MHLLICGLCGGIGGAIMASLESTGDTWQFWAMITLQLVMYANGWLACERLEDR